MTTATQDPTEGWKNYPKNLKLRDSTVSEINYDCNFYHEKLTSDSSRLFGKKAEIKIKVIEFGSTDYNIEDLVGLQDYIQQRRNKKNTRIFLIPQRSSWGPLVINYEALCKFFSYIEVFPAFIDVLQCFGQKEGYEGETYSHYACQETQSHIQISYLIKHVELHGRKEERNPWSVRQMGVYYRDDNKHGNTFVVLNPSRAFQRRLEVVRQTLPIPSAHDIHTLILSSATSSWRSCITDMEKNYESMSVKAQQSNIVGPGEKWGFLTDVCYNDSQDIQVLQDDCFKLGHVLEMTLTILQHIQLSWANLDPASVGSIQVQSNPIQTILIDIEMQLRRAKTILKRLGGTLQLVKSILDLRTLASLESNSQIVTSLARLSQDKNLLIIELTEKASKDADIFKILTVLALVYLPASFVAALMSMGYIKINRTVPRLLIEVAEEFWIFIVLALVLLLTTFGVYFLCCRKLTSPVSR